MQRKLLWVCVASVGIGCASNDQPTESSSDSGVIPTDSVDAEKPMDSAEPTDDEGAPTVRWTQFGSSGFCRGVDSYAPDHQIVAGGDFVGTTALSGVRLTSNGTVDMWLARYSESGDLLWYRNFGGPGSDRVIDVNMGPDGSIYATGMISGTVDFGNGVQARSQGAGDVFVMKLSSGGTPLWIRSFGGTGTDYGNEISVDDNGNSVLAVNTNSSTLRLPNDTMIQNSGGQDALVAYFDASGNFKWAAGLAGPGDDLARGINFDRLGNVLAAGSASNGITIGGKKSVPSGGEDMFLARFTPEGALSWAKHFGSVSNDSARAVDGDGIGDIYFGGYIGASVNLDGIALSPSAGQNMFVAKANASGDILWAHAIATTGDNSGIEADVDGKGNLFIAGNFVGVGTFNGSAGPISASAALNSDFSAHYDSMGRARWVSIGTTGVNFDSSVSLDGSTTTCGSSENNGFYITHRSVEK